MKGPFILPNNVKENDYIELGQLGAYGLTFRSDFNGLYSNSIFEVEDNPTIHRGKALEWLIVSDSNLKEFTNTEGWSYLQQPDDEALRDPDPTTCLARVVIDEGSDGLAAVMFLIYHLRCNIDYTPDASNHGFHNDCNLTVQDVGIQIADTQFSQAANSAHSPYNTGARLEESVDVLSATKSLN